MEPPIVHHMRQCFSSKSIMSTEAHEEVVDSLKILVEWVNRNLGSKFDINDLFSQLKVLKSNLMNLLFFNNILETEHDADIKKPSLLEKDTRVIKELFTNTDTNEKLKELTFLVENCLKITSEGVCESIGSVIGNHLHNRNIGFDSLFEEVFISWNGPPLHEASAMLKRSLDRHFSGGKYHFTRFSSAND